jgi:thiamine pyrophosphokinase
MEYTLIVGGGPVNIELLQSELAKKPDLVIAVDYGGSYLYELGIIPQILIGDFDSLTPQIMDKLANAGAKVIPFPPRKDETDMELALNYAITGGSKTAVILGGLGNRYDHTLSNIGLLIRGLNQGVEVHLRDEAHDLIAINHRVILERKPGWAVSLIPLTVKAGGVTTSGLVYPLKEADLFFERSRGIHNEFAAKTATVELTEGVLLVILFKE